MSGAVAAPVPTATEVWSASAAYGQETNRHGDLRSRLSSATVAFPLNTLPVGRYSINATYEPNAPGLAHFKTSSAAAPGVLVVRQSATTTALRSSVNPSPNGRSVTFSATVSPKAGGTPTGTVNFFNGGATPIGSGTLGVVDGQAVATYSTHVFHGRVNEITAEYVGDNNFTGSRSNRLQQTITPAPVISLRPLDGLTFVRQIVNTTSDPLTVTLSNIGDASLSVDIAIVGPDAEHFTQTNTCQVSLDYVARANSCEIVVTFKPGASGVRSANLSVANPDGAPELLPLSGSSF